MSARTASAERISVWRKTASTGGEGGAMGSWYHLDTESGAIGGAGGGGFGGVGQISPSSFGGRGGGGGGGSIQFRASLTSGGAASQSGFTWVRKNQALAPSRSRVPRVRRARTCFRIAAPRQGWTVAVRSPRI